MFPKLFIGPVSRNTVIATINIANQYNIKLGLIPSRRQVDTDSGYIGCNTQNFSNFIRNSSGNLYLERDHGGPQQGAISDDGLESFYNDSEFLDIIHIDPFKQHTDIIQAAEATRYFSEALFNKNPNLYFEIGTEEGIRKYSILEFEKFLSKVFVGLPDKIAEKILYLVVQGGTKVKEGKNLGHTDHEQLHEFTTLCWKYDKLSKEHNGDYLSQQDIKDKFSNGLDAINIAPEVVTIESTIYLKNLSKEDNNKFYQLVVDSKKWIKWFPQDFIPEQNKEVLVKMCGHYVFETQEFQIIKNNYPNINTEIILNIENKIKEVVGI